MPIIKELSLFDPCTKSNNQVMQKFIYIGIDISKKVLDLSIQASGEEELKQIPNKVKDIKKLLENYPAHQLIIGMENTGRYNYPLYEALANSEAKVFVIPPLHLKKSLGLTRGKNDQIDAHRIMKFIEKNWKDIPEWIMPSFNVQKLKILLTERSSRVKMIKQLKSTQKEYELITKFVREEKLDKLNNQLIHSIQKQVLKIEDQIEQLISNDKDLVSHAVMIQSVPGVGRILSWVLIAKTNNFQSITDPRKMACYSGVVPFDHQSGSSIRKKDRVSIYADKSIKSLLHLGAMSAIRLNNDLRSYYLRKVDEGKNKMSVLNAVRNKIIHRVFAVIRNQEPYINYVLTA